MIEYLEISNQESEIQDISLYDILDVLSEKESALKWSIFDLYCTGDLGNNQSVPELEKKIVNSPKGLNISWGQLVEFSTKLDQVFDFLLIGNNNKLKIENYNDLKNLYGTCDVIIEMRDGYAWEIYSKDKSILDLYYTKFPCSKTVLR